MLNSFPYFYFNNLVKTGTQEMPFVIFTKGKGIFENGIKNVASANLHVDLVFLTKQCIFEITMSKLSVEIWIISILSCQFVIQNYDTAQDAVKERSESPGATSHATAGSQSPGPLVPQETETASVSPGEPQAGPSSLSEPLRVILRHYAWQYEWHLSYFFFF